MDETIALYSAVAVAAYFVRPFYAIIAFVLCMIANPAHRLAWTRAGFPS